MAHGLPSMGDLKDYLVKHLSVAGTEEGDAWMLVRTALSQGDHLENALNGITLPAALTRKIVSLTWRYVNTADNKLFVRSMVGEEDFPVGRLLQALFLSSNKTLDLVTTNYDRVAEFACNVNGLLYSTGFSPGYIQERRNSEPISFSKGGKPVNTVRIWKVHGSLDWFKSSVKNAFCAPIFDLPKDDITPLIVTPGLNKFEQTHHEPFRSVIAGADNALENAGAFLCVGFGFRDTHIQPKIFERCKQLNIPVVVISKELTPEAKNFLKHDAGAKYIGFERADTGTRIYWADEPDGVEFEEPDLWSLSGYLSMVT